MYLQTVDLVKGKRKEQYQTDCYINNHDYDEKNQRFGLALDNETSWIVDATDH